MIYKSKKGQVSYGEAVGILLLDSSAPFIPGDVANATTYKFPVRFQKVSGFTVKKAIWKDPDVFDDLLDAAKKLECQGVRAITGNCGYMAIHQKKLASYMKVPVFLSSLLQIPFISSIIPERGKIGVICADSRSLDSSLLESLGITGLKNIDIKGLEDKKNFYNAVIEETGTLDPGKIEKEVVATAKQMLLDEPEVNAILLECSCLSPYGASVQENLNLPVFDYVTMINYVYSAVVKSRFEGFM
jgi:hypothetical protein